MSVAYTCDGCGEVSKPQSRSFKPSQWFQQSVYVGPDGKAAPREAFGLREARKSDEHEVEVHACSRRCIEAASLKYGSSSVVLPI